MDMLNANLTALNALATKISPQQQPAGGVNPVGGADADESIKNLKQAAAAVAATQQMNQAKQR